MNIEAAPALIRALEDPRANVRHDAAVALGYLAVTTTVSVPALVIALKDPNPEVGRTAVRALLQMSITGIAAARALGEVAKHPDPEVRWWAARARSKDRSGPPVVPKDPDDDWAGNDALGG